MMWLPMIENLAGRGRIIRLVCLSLWLLLAAGSLPAPAEGQSARKLGKLMRVALPITAKTLDQVERFIDKTLEKAEQEGAKRPVLIFRFEVLEDQGEVARHSEFTSAVRLAELVCDPKLNTARTVAYIPESLPGHAVLAAMACDDIVMHADAEFGPVDAEPGTVGPMEQAAYVEFANARKTVPEEIALWLLEPSREVLQVVTDAGRQYVSPKDREELDKNRVITKETPLNELVTGRPGQFTGEEGRRLDCVSLLPEGPEQLADWLKLPAFAMHEDPSLLREWEAIRINLQGPVDATMARQVEKLIDDEIQRREVNFVCLWIDSGGGSPKDSVKLANFLGKLDPNEVRTVAYIPLQARSDAALIALACDHVVMHPKAELGGSGDWELAPGEIDSLRQMIPNPQGPWAGRSWSLIAAMIDPDLEVFQCTRPGEVAYWCDEERDEREAKAREGKAWDRGRQVTRRGMALLVDGEKALEFGLAETTAESFGDFREYYALEDNPMLIEPGWAETLIQALSSPGMSALLLTIAFVAMYAELHAPGIGMGGFVAAVCFLLFFWAHYLGGSANWLEVMLFVAGVSFILLEIFVLPGFGIFGLGGGCLVIVSLILASQTFVIPQTQRETHQFMWSLITIASASAGVVASAVLLRRWLPHAPLLHQVLLQPPVGEEAEGISRREALVALDELVGEHGTTTTQLTPGGKARFADQLIDVITDGEVISSGTEIEVVEVHGNRVIVEAV